MFCLLLSCNLHYADLKESSVCLPATGITAAWLWWGANRVASASVPPKVQRLPPCIKLYLLTALKHRSQGPGSAAIKRTWRKNREMEFPWSIYSFMKRHKQGQILRGACPCCASVHEWINRSKEENLLSRLGSCWCVTRQVNHRSIDFNKLGAKVGWIAVIIMEI